MNIKRVILSGIIIIILIFSLNVSIYGQQEDKNPGKENTLPTAGPSVTAGQKVETTPVAEVTPSVENTVTPSIKPTASTDEEITPVEEKTPLPEETPQKTPAETTEVPEVKPSGTADPEKTLTAVPTPSKTDKPDGEITPTPVIKEFKEPVKKENGAPIKLGSVELFYINTSMGPYSKEERADVVSKRLKILALDPDFKPEFITVVKKDNNAHIMYEDKSIMTVTEDDALLEGLAPQAIAKENGEIIKKSIEEYKKQHSVKGVLTGMIYAVITTLIFLLLLFIAGKIFGFIRKKIESWQGTRIKDLKYQNITILSSKSVIQGIIVFLNLLHYVIKLFFIYIYLSLVLSFFIWTKGIANKLFEYILTAFYKVGQSFIHYLPNLFFILVTIYITNYLLRFIKYIFKELDKGSVALPGFKQEWAVPTYKILYFLFIALAMAVVFPLLPGSQNPAFKGLSIFIGILFSLGSTSAISNVIAGTILIYTDAFKMGDRVKIGDTTGDIVEKTLLVTRIKTIKNVYVTLPNASILSGQIINYSASLQDQGLILNTTITLGYDVPWRKVKKALIDAALATDKILQDPPPFVFQTSLDDFYVSYQLNAYTDEPGKMAKTYSDLHENIQDKCNENDIEILSPHYRAVRDGHMITIPKEYLPENYMPEAFRVINLKNKSDEK